MAGRYKAYPEYKDSEVEWLDNLPSSWQIMKVKFLLKDGSDGIKIGPFGSALKLEDMVESGIRVYGQENVIQKNFTLGKRFISQKKYIDMKVYTAEAGDILVTMMGTSGKCQVVPENAGLGIIDSHLLKLRTNNKILPELFRLLVDETQEIKYQIGKQGKGSIMHGLNSSIVKELELPLPSHEEQERILSFLDHETAKIDTLIAKQEKLIKLLKEKRQAVISHAVTKGLNPDAPMKDSGVEWLGEVPEHWVHSTLKHYCNVVDCKHITAEFFDSGIPLASISEVKTWFVDLGSAKYTNEKYYRELISGGRKPQVGDIIYSRNATVGEAAIVKEGLPPFAMGQDVCLIKLFDELLPEFAMYVLHSGVISQQLELAMVGSTFKRINVDNIRNFALAIPPYQEQELIVDELGNMRLSR